MISKTAATPVNCRFLELLCLLYYVENTFAVESAESNV